MGMGLEFIIPAALSAASLGAGVYSTTKQMEAQEEQAKAVKRQQEAAMQQAATEADRKRAELSARGHMADRARRQKLAAAEAQAISQTGQKLTTPQRGVLEAFLQDERDKYADVYHTTEAEKEFMLRTGRQTMRDTAQQYKTARQATAVGGLADLLTSASKMNLGGAFKSGGSPGDVTLEPWKVRTYR